MTPTPEPATLKAINAAEVVSVHIDPETNTRTSLYRCGCTVTRIRIAPDRWQLCHYHEGFDLNTCREMLRTVLRQGDTLARQLAKQCTCHKHGCESCTAVDRWRKWWPG